MNEATESKATARPTDRHAIALPIRAVPGPRLVDANGKDVLDGWKPADHSSLLYLCHAVNERASLLAERDALRAALEALREIGEHRWRALPADSPEKVALAAGKQALASGDGR